MPSASEPFWRSTQRWTGIIDVAAAATHPDTSVLFNIDNGPYVGLGSFKTVRSLSNKGVDLLWVPDILPGDVNSDNTVNIFDVNLISEHWGEAGPAGDANGDGIVDIFDVNVVSDNWTHASAAATSAVPEPAAWLLAAIVLAGLAAVRVDRARGALVSQGRPSAQVSKSGAANGRRWA